MARRAPLSKEHVNKKGSEGELNFLVAKYEHERKMMTEKLMPGSWLIYNRCGDEKNLFGLGRLDVIKIGMISVNGTIIRQLKWEKEEKR